MLVGCLRLVWDASRSACVWSGVLQLISGLAIGVQLLAGKQLLSQVFAAARDDTGLGSVTTELVLVLISTVFLTIVAAVQSEQQRVVAELVTRHVDDRLLQVAVAVDLEAFETPAFYDRLHRAQLAGQSRPWQMTVGLLSFVSSGVAVVAIVVALVTIQPLLVPLVLITSLPLWLATIRNSRTAHAFAYDITTTDRERRYLAHVLTGREFAKEVRVFDLVAMLRTRYDDLYEHRMTEVRQLARTRLRRLVPAGLMTATLLAVTLAILVALVLDNRLDLADAAVAAVGVQQLALRLRAVYSSAGSLYEGALFLEDFNSFLELEPEVESHRSTGIAPAFSTLSVEAVHFAYPGSDRAALTDVTCDIRQGEVVALVGPNGSGKTTFAKLLCALYRPSSGRVLWDDVDLADCDPADIRRSVSVVFQDFAQYHLSAHDNIAVGRHDRRDDVEGVIRAARAAGAHEFIADLSNGYATRLGRQFDGGRELSMGQWQRIAIARAFFRDAPLVVLDEPTAALDPRAERDLFERIRELAAGRTVVLISHRFSSVRSADRIFVLEAGRIAERGTHDELMTQGGRYARMFNLQASAYLGPGVGVES